MSDQQWTPRIRRIDTNERERLRYVRSLLQENRTDEARDELLALLQEDDKSVRAHLMLGTLYQDQGLLAEALEHFRYAVAVDPMDAQAQFRAGICSLRMNQVEQAMTLLKAALELDPKLVAGHMALAQALSRLGETEAAIAEVEQALRLDPQMASARQLLAQLLIKSGRSKEALEELDGFVTANPDHAGAAVSLARLQGQQGDARKAIELLEAAAKAKPEGANIWAMLGRMKLDAKDYKGAEAAFAEVVRLRPEDRLAPLHLVSALIPQGKFDQARDILKPIPRRGRLAGMVHKCYGDIHVAQKKYDEAVQSYRASILLSEGGENLLAELEPSLGQSKDNEEVATKLLAVLTEKREAARSQLAQRRQAGPGGGGGGGMMRQGRRPRAGQFAAAR